MSSIPVFLGARVFRRTFSLTVLAVFAAASLFGQTSGEPKYPRFDFTPQAGYRTDISFPIEPHVQGTNPQLVLDASPSYGFAFGYRIHEDDLVEFRWATQHSTGHFEDADLSPFAGHLNLNQFHGDFSHEYMVEGWAKWARPFVMLSAGATHFSGTASTSLTRFSFGIGGGMRFYLSNHFGFKVQAEWLPVVISPTAIIVCGTGCTIRVGGTTSSQAEATAGPLFRF